VRYRPGPTKPPTWNTGQVVPGAPGPHLGRPSPGHLRVAPAERAISLAVADAAPAAGSRAEGVRARGSQRLFLADGQARWWSCPAPAAARCSSGWASQTSRRDSRAPCGYPAPGLAGQAGSRRRRRTVRPRIASGRKLMGHARVAGFGGRTAPADRAQTHVHPGVRPPRINRVRIDPTDMPSGPPGRLTASTSTRSAPRPPGRQPVLRLPALHGTTRRSHHTVSLPPQLTPLVTAPPHIGSRGSPSFLTVWSLRGDVARRGLSGARASPAHAGEPPAQIPDRARLPAGAASGLRGPPRARATRHRLGPSPAAPRGAEPLTWGPTAAVKRVDHSRPGLRPSLIDRASIHQIRPHRAAQPHHAPRRATQSPSTPGVRLPPPAGRTTPAPGTVSLRLGAAPRSGGPFGRGPP
jgi:hypothetical protein